MSNSIRHGLFGLARFSGRDRPSVFWPYAAFVVVLVTVSVSAVMVPEMVGTFAKFERFAAANPDKVTVERSATSVSYVVHGHHPDLAPDVGGLMRRTALVIAGAVFLLAAAVSRRLHDSGLRAYWGMLPLPFLSFGFVAMDLLFKEFAGPAEPDMRLFLGVFLNNIAYLTALALLVVLLARKSGTANRFDEPSAALSLPGE